ncbi:LOW QUALITY PROTEIN: hypothetical protein V2J09_009403, partial [Rumex salicifolius]
SPNDDVSNGLYFGVDGAADPLGILPEGFLGETTVRGLVVPKWATQIQVLSHVSTGGFLMHCEWNSVLESVVNGVPMITWPLYAEQKMNVVMLSEDLRVGLRPELGPDGVVRRDENCEGANAADEEGKRMRSRMEELKVAAMSPDHGSSSTKALNEIARIWKNNFVVNGVPMITWPLYAEQKMNVVMLSEDLRVGLRPELGPNMFVRRDEVSRIVRELMAVGEEGKRMRSRIEELKVAASATMSPDHGSSSTTTLNEIARI